MTTRRVLLLVAIVFVASIAATIVLAFQDDDGLFATESHFPTSLSYRPLGHRAFRELLSALGHPTLPSRHSSASRTRDGSLLLIAEPLADEGPDSLEDLVAMASATLVVLPKWLPPKDDGTDPSPIVLGAVSRATSVLARLEVDLSVRRVEAPVWSDGAIEVQGPTQLLYFSHGPHRSIETLKECPDGILFARTHFEGSDLYILSDPDLIANHSLARGSNAEHAVAMVQSIVAPNAPVLFEETLHGLYLAPSLVRSVLRPPLAWATLQAALIILALVAIATVRFGKARASESSLPAGKRIFIDNIAEIQSLKKSLRSSLMRYFDYSLNHVCGVLNITNPEREQRIKILLAFSHRYGLTEDPITLQQEVMAIDPKRRSKVRDILLARRIQKWRKDVIYATRRPT